MTTSAPETEKHRRTELIRRACNGDKDAIATLYSETLPYVHAVCRRRAVPQHEADDAIAEGWYRVLRRMRRGDFEVSNFEAYLGRAVQNVLYESWRSSQRVFPAEMAHTDWIDPHDPHAELLNQLAPEPITIAFSQLPLDRRELLHATIIEGRTYADVAREEGTTSGAMANRAMRARQRLADLYATSA